MISLKVPLFMDEFTYEEATFMVCILIFATNQTLPNTRFDALAIVGAEDRAAAANRSKKLVTILMVKSWFSTMRNAPSTGSLGTISPF